MGMTETERRSIVEYRGYILCTNEVWLLRREIKGEHITTIPKTAHNSVLEQPQSHDSVTFWKRYISCIAEFQ